MKGKAGKTAALRLAVWSLSAVALAAVFAAYLHPDLVLTLATQMWNCF